jgi:hypothetical protein
MFQLVVMFQGELRNIMKTFNQDTNKCSNPVAPERGSDVRATSFLRQ